MNAAVNIMAVVMWRQRDATAESQRKAMRGAAGRDEAGTRAAWRCCSAGCETKLTKRWL